MSATLLSREELVKELTAKLQDAHTNLQCSEDRVKDLGLAIAGFIEGSFTYTAQTVDDTFHITQKVNKLSSDINKSVSSSIDSASSSINSALTLKPPNLTNGKGVEFNKTPVDEYENEPSPILEDEQKEVDDKYQQCVIENVKPIPPDSQISKDDLRNLQTLIHTDISR
jgi:hypothetical protein